MSAVYRHMPADWQPCVSFVSSICSGTCTLKRVGRGSQVIWQMNNCIWVTTLGIPRSAMLPHHCVRLTNMYAIDIAYLKFEILLLYGFCSKRNTTMTAQSTAQSTAPRIELVTRNGASQTNLRALNCRRPNVPRRPHCDPDSCIHLLL